MKKLITATVNLRDWHENHTDAELRTEPNSIATLDKVAEGVYALSIPTPSGLVTYLIDLEGNFQESDATDIPAHPINPITNNGK